MSHNYQGLRLLLRNPSLHKSLKRNSYKDYSYLLSLCREMALKEDSWLIL